MDPHASIAAMIVGKKDNGSEGIEGPEEGSHETEMLHCANDMMKSMHAKDAHGFHKALQNWKVHSDAHEADMKAKE